MNREYYLKLAHSGLRMPFGADLTLHETADPEAVKNDSEALGIVVEQTARRYRTPLAFPLMDLTLEKLDLLTYLGVPPAQVDSYHFPAPPPAGLIDELRAASARPFAHRIAANQEAVRYIQDKTDLLPVGMLIGPFSLMTKLISDPITPVAMAAAGDTAEDNEGVCLVERLLALAEATVLRSAQAQIEAGARAVIVCEPAANTVYLSPRRLRSGSNILERYVLGPNRRLREFLGERDVDLIFHNCGELLTDMVRQFAIELKPAMLSLGSSRKLWEDAAVVPGDIVLFGNLPTKMFYSDSVMPEEEVRRRTRELRDRMAECGHAHILGSECDVLHVAEAAETIRRKVQVMLED
ncbi:MAG: uroporphyrinogen decarboxylase family protein [Bryobacteraceae bacterium]|nr:uroporphyrinogen decarboxylase family protein [Bryobacteraceae bacterium]